MSVVSTTSKQAFRKGSDINTVNLARQLDLALRENRKRPGPAPDIEDRLARLKIHQRQHLFTKGLFPSACDQPEQKIVAGGLVQDKAGPAGLSVAFGNRR